MPGGKIANVINALRAFDACTAGDESTTAFFKNLAGKPVVRWRHADAKLLDGISRDRISCSLGFARIASPS